MLFNPTGLKCNDVDTLKDVGVFSQTESKGDVENTIVNKLAFSGLSSLVWKQIRPEANLREKNRRARNFIERARWSMNLRRFSASDHTRLVEKHKHGWVYDRAVMTIWGAPESVRQSILNKKFGESTLGEHSLRSLIGNGFNRVFVYRFPTKKPPAPAKPRPETLYRTHIAKMFRMRFERWFFKQLGNRTYVWFSNIWLSLTAQFNKKRLNQMYQQAMRYLAKKGTQFYIEATQAHIVFQSLFMAITSVTGLQFFMKNLSRLISSYRSHWSLIRHMMTLFFKCKNYFWFKTLYQYRLVMRGKFGGHMRARQEVLQHGVVKIHQWDLNINYYRIQPITKYGVFSVRFWLQMRDMRILRLRRVTDEIQRQSRSEARLRFFGHTRKDFKG